MIKRSLFALGLVASSVTWAQSAPVICKHRRVAQARSGGALPIAGPLNTTEAKPILSAGLTGLPNEGSGSLESSQLNYTLRGSRIAASIGLGIHLCDDQTGLSSSPGNNTAGSASYGLAIVGMRPSWNTSAITGEMDGQSIFLRQAHGDTAGILSNIGVRSGYAAFAESFTFSADNAGGVVKGVRTQIGVVNARDGGEYGISLIAENGRNAAALRVQQNNSAIWNDAFQIVNASGSIIARIRAADGAYIGPLGYGTASLGLGGAVTQGTSRTTSVALNTLNGEITLFKAMTTAGQVTTFTLNDSKLAPTDHLILEEKAGTGIYFLGVSQKRAGGFNISLYTPLAVVPAEAPVISFAIVKGSND